MSDTQQSVDSLWTGLTPPDTENVFGKYENINCDGEFIGNSENIMLDQNIAELPIKDIEDNNDDFGCYG